MNETNAVGNVTEGGKSAGDRIVQKVEASDFMQARRYG